MALTIATLLVKVSARATMRWWRERSSGMSTRGARDRTMCCSRGAVEEAGRNAGNIPRRREERSGEVISIANFYSTKTYIVGLV